MQEIKVLIVDDSALIRKMLADILGADPRINVVGTAADPLIAREKIKALNPDVITLDIEMPKMDGLTFLRKIMALRPMPVVMISTLTAKGAEVTMEALRIGAVDFLCKPEAGSASDLHSYGEELVAKVKAAANARLRISRQSEKPDAVRLLSSSHKPVGLKVNDNSRVNTLIALGSSTGGTEAIREVLERLPRDTPPIVIAQHIPAGFSRAFADRVNTLVDMNVSEAKDGEIIRNGHVYVAPGNFHLTVKSAKEGSLHCRTDSSDPVNRHRPSVDVLFESVARLTTVNLIGVLLTGMGKDGAQGLLTLHNAGVPTIAQDEQSSVVWGMPRAAVELGAASEVVPLEKIAETMLRLAGKQQGTNHAQRRAV